MGASHHFTSHCCASSGAGRNGTNYVEDELMRSMFKFLRDESGASAAEYALILALVAAVIVGGLSLLGTDINSQVGNVAGVIANP